MSLFFSKSKTASLKKNVLANYMGQGWRAIMGLAFIPYYIKYLGIEAYGLIGIFALLQAWLALLDMGMKPSLVREMARFTGGEHNVQTIRDLLRSIEIVGIGVALLVALGVWLASGWLASDWLNVKTLPLDVVAHAFTVMGCVTALRFIENIYISCIVGLQRQVLQNTVTSVMATLRGLGAVGVLAWVSPSIDAFFLWQGLISLATVVIFAFVVYRTLPEPERSARFSRTAMMDIWRFAGGMAAITFLSLLLTQVDKILLSRMLPLETFGYYALATSVANGLYMLTGPVTTAFYPRFTELVSQGNEEALKKIYHQGAQLVTVLMGSAAVVLMVFGDRVLLLWTGDPGLTQNVAPIMTLLVAGTLCNGLMWIPYHLQLAHGWTRLSVYINCVAVCVLIPCIVYVVPKYGAISAAWVWVGLNLSYLIFDVYFMHRRLLTTEKWNWYVKDIVTPLTVSMAFAGLLKWMMPIDFGRLGEFLILATISGGIVLTSVLCVPLAWPRLSRYFRTKSKTYSLP